MKSNKVKLRIRREKALERLKEQLVSKTKTFRVFNLDTERGENSFSPLSEKDIKRITKEIETLESRLKGGNYEVG
jgi:hypothetical protein